MGPPDSPSDDNRIARFLEADRSTAGHLLVLALIFFVVYGGSLFSYALTDDTILYPKADASSWNFWELSRAFRLGPFDLTDGWVPESLEDFELYFFRPLCVATFKLDLALWNDWTHGYHLTNLLLQYLVVVLFYFWVGHFGFQRTYQFVAALLFALYLPNQFTVNWLSGRTELLAAVFMLATILFVGEFWRGGGGVRYVVGFASFLFALACKENVVIFPLALTLAAWTLYAQSSTHRTKALSLLPFFVVVPFYLWIRSVALGGFPVPTADYYMRDIFTVDFVPFIASKLVHAVNTLVYQLPGPLFPMYLERSPFLLGVLAVPAAVTAAVLICWLPGRMRWFLLGWVALAMGPTLTIGHNPVYYYLPSFAMVMVYVFLYAAFRKGDARRRRVAGRLVAILVVGGVVFGVASTIRHWYDSSRSRTQAMNIVEAAAGHPEAQTIYCLDVPPRHQYVLAHARMLEPDLASKQLVMLSLCPVFLEAAPSIVEQVDEYSFITRSEVGPYFTGGFATVIMRDHYAQFEVGMQAATEDYEVEVVAVAESGVTRLDKPHVRVLRAHFELPAPDHVAPTALEFRFREKLDSSELVFLQMTPGDTVRELTFNHSSPDRE